MYRVGKNLPGLEAKYRVTFGGAIKLAAKLAEQYYTGVEVEEREWDKWTLAAMVKIEH